jgi:hypothetical protein
MQIQQANPGMQALLAKLLPLLGKTAGTAAGGPIGGALGGLSGAGLEGLLSQQEPEAQNLGGQGMQQTGQEQMGGPMASMIRNLLEQLSGSQREQQQSLSPTAPEEATQDQRQILEGILNKMSGNGKDLMLKYLKGMVAKQIASGGQ